MIEVSIVTITYNDKRGLAQTRQSLKPLLSSKIAWEHIIVDSSPEISKSVLEDGEENWPRTHVIEPPRGIYAAMNTGWRRASGKLVIFLNSGDRIKNREALEKAIIYFNDDSHLDLLLASAELYRDGNYLYTKNAHASFLRNILGSNNICHQSLVYRRTALEKVGDFSTKYGLAGDYEHHFRCYLEGLKHKSVKLPLVEFDMGGQSSQFRKVLREYAEIHRDLAPRLSPTIVRMNELLLRAERLRLGIVKGLASSRLSGKLRPLWVWWHRL